MAVSICARAVACSLLVAEAVALTATVTAAVLEMVRLATLPAWTALVKSVCAMILRAVAVARAVRVPLARAKAVAVACSAPELVIFRVAEEVLKAIWRSSSSTPATAILLLSLPWLT